MATPENKATTDLETKVVLRPADLPAVCGFSVSTARRNPSFPKAVQLSPRAIGWLRSEVMAWLESRPRGYLPADNTPTRARRKSAPV